MLAYDPDFPPPDPNQEGKLPFQIGPIIFSLTMTTMTTMISKWHKLKLKSIFYRFFFFFQ